MGELPSESLLAQFVAAGIQPRFNIDQIVLRFESSKPVPACSAHTVVRKAIGEAAVYGYLCHPGTQDDDVDIKKAAYRVFSVALHELVPDRKHGIPGISMHQLKTIAAQLAPSQAPVITYTEIALDLWESTPLLNRERAEIAVAFILKNAAAVGMSKIKGARNKDEAPVTFKNGDVEAMIQYGMTGYSLFTKDAQGRELKAYIKTHDTFKRLNSETGKFETVIKGALPAYQHRLRIEWTFQGDACLLKSVDDLLTLKPLASLFYVNKLGAFSTKVTSAKLKPVRPGHRRKKPKDARADTEFNRWIRGAARCFQLRLGVTEKGAVKTVS